MIYIYWKPFTFKLYILLFYYVLFFNEPIAGDIALQADTFNFNGAVQFDKKVNGAVPLNSKNIDMTLASNELVIINFYADWCRFSGMLAPIFNEAANKVAELYKQPGKVIMGKIDCDSETAVASRFQITKYPTIKVLINGQPAKREYRGKRSVEAFVSFVQKQLEDPVQEVSNLVDSNHAIDEKMRVVIGYFDSKDSKDYEVFRKVATNLKDDCSFFAGVGEKFRAMHPANESIVVFRPDRSSPESEHQTFKNLPSDYDALNIWTTSKCVPLVREITFENAEEITEEGLPFLIFFYNPKNLESVKLFKDIVSLYLIEEKQRVNFLTADGLKFAHPLQHLGKRESDLPVIVIDSFKHMYQFPKDADFTQPGRLKQFIDDLYSGKLHKEYHLGPQDIIMTELINDNQLIEQTLPPESTFKKLAPSKNRYTLLKEEL
ncbi:endoplasmic reticulum resident protein 44-like [Daktulosphaira vitifoliae]|uniref:endoplasmic reticulum resident protein 44-like n=1 Tax=Daktulosphaira vitifoliae TaxID=58002 RepID=UPI0021AA7BF5|nr:endoplasmic reticulum resident protein 44-like [Daktulosphaira vitifoliae]XP_050533633.1 endoplasmic reticulum resident protein 44-like [Daktulosphaira vitifoliae]XP_050533634.1 endoplasmic reticulum resident protein 44-like [Daktulosphaira vitifoliae]XP_050533635.1 endoplasmic reticulum resident protein 44-like [Daktulosphaira vitifoliae]XP_050533636.1 endoplasmic reticulum resident protein 44-like [Daktulosphaira vitifoliae]